MTADARLRIGGWAALLIAILAPIELAVVVGSADRGNPVLPPAAILVELVRFCLLLAAVVGLDRLHRSLAPDFAGTVRVIGAIAAIAVIALDATRLASLELGTIGDLVALAASVLVGLWFIAGGAILMREGGGLARIGWTAELGGLGQILAAIATAIRLSGPVGEGLTWLEWFRVLGLFVVVYLVRIWLYVVRGRLPGPGIL